MIHGYPSFCVHTFKDELKLSIFFHFPFFIFLYYYFFQGVSTTMSCMSQGCDTLVDEDLVSSMGKLCRLNSRGLGKFHALVGLICGFHTLINEGLLF